jgi:hypothetical protein
MLCIYKKFSPWKKEYSNHKKMYAVFAFRRRRLAALRETLPSLLCSFMPAIAGTLAPVDVRRLAFLVSTTGLGCALLVSDGFVLFAVA